MVVSENTEGKATLAGRLPSHLALTSANALVARAPHARLAYGFLRRFNLTERSVFIFRTVCLCSDTVRPPVTDNLVSYSRNLR